MASIAAFNLSAKDAQAVRKEFLELPMTGEEARPIGLETLVALRPGQAMARLGGGAFALPLRTLEPLREPSPGRGERILEISWETYGAGPFEPPRPSTGGPPGEPKSRDDFLE